MNSKGQISGLGVIMMVFVAVLVGVIIFQQIAQTIGTTTDEFTYTNVSITLPQNGSSIYLTDIRALSSAVIINDSDVGEVMSSANYTVTNDVVYNGGLAVMITTSADTTSGWNGTSANVSGTAQPLTYISNSSGRGIAALILIFLGLAIAVIAIYPIYQDPNFRAMIGK